MKLNKNILALTLLMPVGLAFGQSNYCIYEVDDYLPGPSGSAPYQYTEYNGDVYFGGIDPAGNAELLKYDGTSITMAADIRPGGLSSQPNHLTVFDGDLYFAANNGTNGTELYKWDGTTATLAADINSGVGHSYPAELTVVGNMLYFTADDGVNGVELWQFDGTTASIVQDIQAGAGPSFPLNLFAHDTKLYFQADDGSTGRELYEWDGSTMNMWDINPSGDSNPSFFYNWNGNLIWSCTDGANGMELWEFVGTTPTMTEIAPGGPNGNPTQFVTFQGDLYFRASNLTSGAELYTYDGTTLSLVADIMVGNFHSNPDNITVYGNEMLFTANDGATGYELYRYTGSGSPAIIQEINPGSGAAFNAFNTQPFVVVGTKIFVLANDGTNGEEWWAYDGNSLELTKDLYPGSTGCSASNPISHGDYMYFTAQNGSNGEEMHIVDINAQLWDSTIVVTCGSWISPGGQSFSGNGQYDVTDVIPSSNCPGCDSLVYTDLTITSDSVLEVNYSVINCGTWTSPGGQIFTAEGTYMVSDTFNSVVCPGTDSVINVDLEIVQLSNAVTTFGNLLIAQASGAQYQWLTCDPDTAFIPGATGQDYQVTQSGWYAVQLSLSGCVDTSTCIEVIYVDGIEENILDAYVNLFPNPASEMMTVQTDLAGDFYIRIYDQTGKLVDEILANQSNKDIPLGRYESGIYILEITNEDGRVVKKFVKE